jgi:ABC-type amino acid transport substrate-binding protein
MKHLYLFILSLALGFASAASAGQSKPAANLFRIGYFELAPHIVQGADGELYGPALEYAQRILARMGNPAYELKGYPVQRALQMLQSGEIDMVLFAAKTPATDREAYVMTDSNIVLLRPALVVKQTSKLTEPVAPQDLLNTTLAYWSGGHIPALLRHSDINLVNVSGEAVYERGIRMVELSRADAFFHVDGLALRWWLKNRATASDVRLVPLPIQVEGKSLFSQESAQRYKATYEEALNAEQQIQSYTDFFLNYQFEDTNSLSGHSSH